MFQIKQNADYSIMSIAFGTFMQWYDFAIFGSLAVLLSNIFFPHYAQYDRLINTYLLFAASFILAPIGAYLIGLIGDTKGRKIALLITILGMGTSTFIIGILPGYETLGIFSTFTLIFCRLLQGFSSGAEFTTSAVYLIESSPKSNETLMGCLTSVCYSLGSLGGVFIAGICTSKVLPVWFWRAPFLLSVFGAGIALYVRKNLPEINLSSSSATLLRYSKIPERNDVMAMITTFLLASTSGILAYGTFVWLISYLILVSKFSVSMSIFVSVVAMLTDALVEPILAFYIDKYCINKKLVSQVGLLFILVFSIPVMYLLTISSLPLSFICAFLLGFMIAIVCAPLNTLMVLSHKKEGRCAGFGVAFNLGVSIFGGTAPVILTFILKNYGAPSVPLYYMFAAILGFIALHLMSQREIKYNA